MGKVEGVFAGQGGCGLVFVDEEVQGFAAVRALCVVHPAGINPDNLGGIGAFDGEIDAEASLLRVFAAAGVVVRVHG